MEGGIPECREYGERRSAAISPEGVAFGQIQAEHDLADVLGAGGLM